MEEGRPSDLNQIDGPPSSPTFGREEQRDETLARPGDHGGAPRSSLGRWRVVEATRRSAATSAVGGNAGSNPWMMNCASAVQEPTSVLQMVIDLVILGHKKGRVRFLRMVGAHASRGRG
jgi:hypothetical protein